MPRVAIITTCWRRPILTSVVMWYYRNLVVKGFDIGLFAGVSPEDEFFEQNKESAESCGFDTVVVPNRPLADKHNAVLQSAILFKPHAILTIGSDDLVTPEFIAEAFSVIGPDTYATPEVVYFLDLESSELIGRPLCQNGIRMFSRRSVEDLCWNLWDAHEQSMAMDAALDRGTHEQLKAFPIPDHGPSVVLDIKDGTDHRVSFASYKNNLKGTTVMNVKSWMDQYFPKMRVALGLDS